MDIKGPLDLATAAIAALLIAFTYAAPGIVAACAPPRRSRCSTYCSVGPCWAGLFCWRGPCAGDCVAHDWLNGSAASASPAAIAPLIPCTRRERIHHVALVALRADVAEPRYVQIAGKLGP